MPKTERTVHPRVRGEHVVASEGKGSEFGSSPRPRGTLDQVQPFAAEIRFIPASAGNTPSSPGMAHGFPVHPRVRGEHWVRPLPLASTGGSSPRPRGTRLADLGQHGVKRFIPASAGNTGSARRPASHAAVHPRVRGEHSKNNKLIKNDNLTSQKSTDFSARLQQRFPSHSMTGISDSTTSVHRHQYPTQGHAIQPRRIANIMMVMSMI